MSEEPKLNQIIFIDLDYADEWDKLLRTKPYLIIKIIRLKKEDKKDFLLLHLLPITSQDEVEVKEEMRKQFISQHKIHWLPNCLKIDPSFIRIQRNVELTISESELTKYLCNKCPQGCFKRYINLKNNLVDEYDFIVKKHEDYRSDKANILKLLPPIEIEIGE